jgi:hypothetical protein
VKWEDGGTLWVMRDERGAVVAQVSRWPWVTGQYTARVGRAQLVGADSEAEARAWCEHQLTWLAGRNAKEGA